MLHKASQNRLIKYLYNLNNKIKIQKTYYSTRNIHKSETLKLNFETGDIILNAGKLARLTDASATGKHDGSEVLVGIVLKPSKQSQNFLPLSVNYIQKLSASGRIPLGNMRRETNITNAEILIGRMIDRSIRPLFNAEHNMETQVNCNLMALGKQNPDVLCINTVSYTIHASDIPWLGPVGCVRVGMEDSKFIINPTRKSLEKSPLNLVVTVNTDRDIVMMEAWADNLKQNLFIDALEYGVNEAYKVTEAIRTSVYTSDRNQEEKNNVEPVDSVFYDALKLISENQLYYEFTSISHDKRTRDDAVVAIKNKSFDTLRKDKNFQKYFSNELEPKAHDTFTKIAKEVFRKAIIVEEKRCDGRKLNEMRPISCYVNYLEGLHGSALFQRGQTQVLSTLTLDSSESMYNADVIPGMVSPSLTKFDKKFMLHYEFPQYAVNEIEKTSSRAPDRREIGHGALAEKALYPLVPSDLNYTIRILCEVLESNGSSSMASVCAGSLALVDAGVNMPELGCGVAMGLVTNKNENNEIEEYKILTDLSGIEDFMGDTDFKIAGTAEGITAVQVDVKISGIPMKIAREVMEQSKDARGVILDKMKDSLENRKAKNPNILPVTKEIQIDSENRSKITSSGGSILKNIERSTGAKLQFRGDHQSLSVFASNGDIFKEAMEMINEILESKREPEFNFGGVYTAKVVEIVQNGVMVKLHPNMKAVLLHNSQISAVKIQHGSASGLKENDEIQVKYFGRDPVSGQVRISRKALIVSKHTDKNLFEVKSVNS